MRMTTVLRNTALRTAILLPTLGLAALPIYAQQQQQDTSQQQTGDAVADAARKAREQKKNAPRPKKVLTEDDIASKPTTPSGGAAAAEQAPTGATPGTEQAAPGTAPAGAGEQKNDEASWRKRFKEQRDKIANAEKELDVLQRELDKSQIQYYPDPQKALMEQNSRKDVNDKTAKIEEKKKQIAQLRQGLSDLEDQLRKAGGDPGWSRE